MATLDFKALHIKAHKANPRNFTLLNALYRSSWNGRSVLDFDDSLWEQDFEETKNFLEENGISEFTVTSGSNNLFDFLGYFTDNGWKLDGMLKIKTGQSLIKNEEGDYVRVPKYSFAIKVVQE